MLCAAVPGAADPLKPDSLKPVSLKPWTSDQIPPLALDRLDGPPVDLATLRGQPVVVHFFATWCAPCIEEMASLDAFAASAGAPVVLAVNVGEVEARLRTFFRTRPVAFPILLDRDRATMKAWKVEGLPASFVLDRELRPALKTEEPLDWTSPAVTNALAALSPQAASPVQPMRDKGETPR
ncbi:TlpA family protein disulfide reductase [Bosea sp. BH3]|nr:TlpA family protein disulfide reductase [Bosea sp. BH3]